MFIAMALDVMVITRKPATGARRPSIRAFRNLLRTSLSRPDWQLFWIEKHCARFRNGCVGRGNPRREDMVLKVQIR